MASKIIILSTLALVLLTVQARPDISYTPDERGRITSARATINRSDLKTGSKASGSIRKSIGAQPNEDAGHLIGAKLGGTGNDERNFVRQNRHINRGEYRDFEREVSDLVNDWGSAGVEVQPQYTRGSSNRPSGILYTVYNPQNPQQHITRNFANRK